MQSKFCKICFISLVIIIFLFSHQSGEQSAALSDWIAKLLFGQDYLMEANISSRPFIFGFSVRKLAHVSLYFLLGCSAVFSSFVVDKKQLPIHILKAFMACLFIAVTDEIHQVFVPERAGRITDVMIDSLGVLLAIAIYILIINCILVRHRKCNH